MQKANKRVQVLFYLLLAFSTMGADKAEDDRAFSELQETRNSSMLFQSQTTAQVTVVNEDPFKLSIKALLDKKNIYFKTELNKHSSRNYYFVKLRSFYQNAGFTVHIMDFAHRVDQYKNQASEFKKVIHRTLNNLEAFDKLTKDLITAEILTPAGEADFHRLYLALTGRLPLGFESEQEWEKFREELHGIFRVRNIAARLDLVGSATTFYSLSPTKPVNYFFDKSPNKRSDIDISVQVPFPLSAQMAQKCGIDPDYFYLFGGKEGKCLLDEIPELILFRVKWGGILKREINFAPVISADAVSLNPFSISIRPPFGDLSWVPEGLPNKELRK